MSTYDVRLNIVRIVENEGYKCVRSGLDYYIDSGKYRIYFSEAKIISMRNIIKLDWIVKEQKDKKWIVKYCKSLILRLGYLESDVKGFLDYFRKSGYLEIAVDNLGVDLDKEIEKLVEEYLGIIKYKEQDMVSPDLRGIKASGLESVLKAAFKLGVESAYRQRK